MLEMPNLPHPGTILTEEFLQSMGLSVYALSKAIHLSCSRMNEICNGRQGISVNITSRLREYFGVDPQWFLNMQCKYDLHVERQALADELSRIETRPVA